MMIVQSVLRGSEVTAAATTSSSWWARALPLRTVSVPVDIAVGPPQPEGVGDD